MKKIIFILALFPFLLALRCVEDDAPCGGFTEIEKPDLITIENSQPVYNMNDVLWLSSTVDRFQTINESNTTVDLFAKDEKLSYYIELIKLSAFNDFNYIFLNQNSTIIEQGEALFNTIILVKDGEQYKSKIGIKLLESGTYTLKITNISSYHVEPVGCNYTVFAMYTDFNGIESNTFTFEVE
ncbi:hypothetical protein [Flavobacterium sp. UBA6135]|uniref:hypothetical protein n=1 Tax=Flavobacterium sp. UBA6135 TaxID=1946553 RepID=UPI0025BB0E5A|nr:hypothetical protein [Flavobacterium sp. UBA6135]